MHKSGVSVNGKVVKIMLVSITVLVFCVLPILLCSIWLLLRTNSP